ncbi:MAG: adenylate/guanylate cyclase domain-containing protein, partial [Halanaerobiales bacterium]
MSKSTTNKKKAILFTDISSFTTYTSKYGEEAAKNKLQRLDKIVKPILLEKKGNIEKRIGDSLFITFDNVLDAVSSVIDLFDKLLEEKKDFKEDEKILLSAGIGYGSLNYTTDGNIISKEVNLASKLGEDTASPFELLITQDAYNKLVEEDSEQEGKFIKKYYGKDDVEYTIYQLQYNIVDKTSIKNNKVKFHYHFVGYGTKALSTDGFIQIIGKTISNLAFAVNEKTDVKGANYFYDAKLDSTYFDFNNTIV